MGENCKISNSKFQIKRVKLEIVGKTIKKMISLLSK